MEIRIHNSWTQYLEKEFNKLYFRQLTDFVNLEYKIGECYPKKAKIFNAFLHCSFQNIKVVIIGQDPYHGENQANGLCFSVNEGIKHPPSLKNIFKEIETDLNIPYPKNGNLERWAKQGVLLLNTVLTVRHSKPASHKAKGWEKFTDAVIKTISEKKRNTIFLLWGASAKKKAKLINENHHFILSSGHPSPLSANKGYWFNNKHFSTANSLLKTAHLSTIDWS